MKSLTVTLNDCFTSLVNFCLDFSVKIVIIFFHISTLCTDKVSAELISRNFNVFTPFVRNLDQSVIIAEFLETNISSCFDEFFCNWDTVWKNDKFSLTKKIFRQINSLVLYLVKPLISRNVCQKRIPVISTLCESDFSIFYTVMISWKSIFFRQRSRR